MASEDEEILRLRLIPYNARLVEARKGLGFTQKDLYLLTGIQPQKIGWIETLRCIASDLEKSEIASALCQSVEYLFPEELEALVSTGVFRERVKYLSRTQVEALTLAYQDEELEKFERTYLLPETVEDVVSSLTSREAKVINLRYGLKDNSPRLLEVVGKEFNVTRERVRQIEQKALRKLRHPTRSRKLKDFLY